MQNDGKRNFFWTFILVKIAGDLKFIDTRRIRH